jgi:hypothetical protein
MMKAGRMGEHGAAARTHRSRASRIDLGRL